MREYITLSAYTDAASFNNGMKVPQLPEHSASAGVILYEDTVIASKHSFNPNTSISFGEIYAIYMILREVGDWVIDSGRAVNLTIHTDSAYALQTLTEWMYTWKSRSINGYWVKSDGTQPAYQYMLETIDKILNYQDGLNVQIKHISGHIDFSKQKHIDKARKRYRRFNGLSISDNELAYHCFYNDICDKYAKKVLELGMRGNKVNERDEKFSEKYFSRDYFGVD